jgi:hypothetical protein
VVYANHKEDDKGNEVYELAVESQGYEESGSGGVVRIMESERKSSVEAMQGGDQLAFLRDLVDSTPTHARVERGTEGNDRED